jgi:ELWxxDGT repeat protein
VRRKNDRRRKLAKISFEQLENRNLLAVDLQLVANINETDPWDRIHEMESAGSQTFFVASEIGQSRRDLWRTDGTTLGTIRLVELDSDHKTRYLTNVNGQLYFRGVDAANGTELWKSDGTVAGTVMVRDIRPGGGSTVLSNLKSHNGELFFSANGHLFRSNGSLLGTKRVVDILPNADDQVRNVTPVGSSLYFSAKSASSGEDLFKTDGTAANTVRVANVQGVNGLGGLVNVSGQLFFTPDNQSLWKTVGLGDTAMLVSELNPGADYPRNLTNVNGTVFFSSFAEIWKSDGTAAGTVPLTNVGDDAFNFFDMDGTLYFSGGSTFSGDGYELWKSDGSASGTFMVKDINPGFNEGYGFSSYPGQFRKVQGALYFIASNGVWTTDGTELGTTMVESGINTVLSELDGDLLMARLIPYPANGTQIWRRDPSDLAATLIERSGVGLADSNPSAFVNLNGVMYFTATDGVVGNELFKLDNGTVSLVQDINPGPQNSGISNLTSFNGALYFSAYSPTTGQRLWRSDGTPGGTQLLASVFPGADPGQPVFTQVGNNLFFRGYDATGWELWKTDGTVTGTMRVLDIHPGGTYEYGVGFLINSSFPTGLTNLNGTLYFSAYNGASGRELWKSDGTPGGTTLAVDIFPGQYAYYPYTVNSGNVSNVTEFKGSLYFVAYNETEGRGIWKSDGTAAGTEMMKRFIYAATDPRYIMQVGEQLYFTAPSSIQGDELWRSDGTTAGSVLVKDIRPGAISSQIKQLTNVNGRIYFTAEDGVHGREVWVTDGTAAGTNLVRDIRSGIDSQNQPLSSSPDHLTNLNGTLYFTADDGVRGRELYKAFRTASGASLVRDLVPGAVGSEPTSLFAHNGAVYFSAKTNLGRELWKAAPASPVVRFNNTVLNYREDESPLRFASSATLTDADSPILVGGEVTVTFTSPYRVGDAIQIENFGNIQTVGSLVLYRDTIFGRFSGGNGGVPLSIALNQNASVVATQALIQSISYVSTSQNPFVGRRVIRLEVFDGDGAVSIGRHVRIDVTAVNDAPVIVDSSGDVNYQLNAALGVRIASGATVTDPDSSDFDGGRLRIVVTGGDRARNRLELAGTLFSIDGSNNLLRNGLVIGTVVVNSGMGMTPFDVTFNANATAGYIQQLLRAITFKTVGSTSVSNRSISISLTDGDGGPGASLLKTVVVT